MVRPSSAGRRGFLPAAETRCVVAAQVLARQRVGQHADQHHGQCSAQEIGRDHGHRPGAGHRPGKAHGSSRQQRMPGHVHAPRVLQGGRGRAPHRGALVHAEQRGRVGGGKHGEQRRHQDEATTTHDRIHEAGEQRGQRNKQQFHDGDCHRHAQAKKNRPTGGRFEESGISGDAETRFWFWTGLSPRSPAVTSAVRLSECMHCIGSHQRCASGVSLGRDNPWHS